MYLDEFYTNIKDIINFFGNKWGEKEKILVTIDHNRIVFSMDNIELSLKIGD